MEEARLTETSSQTRKTQAKKRHPLQAVFEMISGFVPWIVYWIIPFSVLGLASMVSSWFPD